MDPRKKMKVYALVALSLFCILPCLSILITNLFILMILKKSSKKLLSKTAIITLMCISLSFCVFIIPTIVRVILQSIYQNRVPSWYLIFALEMLFVNSCCNLIIYTITNVRLRSFLLRRLLRRHKLTFVSSNSPLVTGH